MILELQYQKVPYSHWAAREIVDKKMDAALSRFGFPPKRCFRCVAGGHDTSTLIMEREWESLAAMEAGYARILNDPEWLALQAELFQVIEWNQMELYYGPLP